jgi:hypothetical protein
MSEATTPAAEAAKPVKMVKIKALRDVQVNRGTKDERIVLPGTICMVTEEEAKDLCDTKFRGYHPFYGNMPEIGPLMGIGVDGAPLPNPLDRKMIARAVRVA